MERIITSRDYAKAREAAEARPRHNVQQHYYAQMQREAHKTVLATNPEIGELVRKGKPVYYVMRNGLPVEAHDPNELLKGES